MERTFQHATQRGVSLVESLVALVVMSVGMLGIASLYVTSLQTGRSALVRTQAVNLVNDMADRIRANSRGRAAYKLSDYKPADLSSTTPPACIAAYNCTPAALAAYDLATWLASFKGSLPANATGNVIYTAGASGQPDTYTVSVTWQEAGEAGNFNYDVNLELLPVSP